MQSACFHSGSLKRPSDGSIRLRQRRAYSQRRAFYQTPHHHVSYQAAEQSPALRATDDLRQSLHTSAKEKVMQLLSQGYNNYNPGELGGAVAELLVSCPISKDQLVEASFKLGQGTWEVFYAPHIARMSSVLGTKFEPIQYDLRGTKLSSYVKYSNPVIGSGWLSASGSMGRKYDDTVDIKFEHFWVDGPDSLRFDITEVQNSSQQVDSIIDALGRSSFFPEWAVFPVMYLDDELCVFEFPPLNSKIAVRKIARPGLAKSE